MTPLCPLRRALSDPKLLGTTLQGDSWAAWRALLIAAMGEALTPEERALFMQLTGREREPLQRVAELVAVVGRRGGKSRALAVLAVYLAALCEHRLAPGERGLVLVVAQNQRAARIVLDYAEACFDAAPALRALVVSRNNESIQLNTGVQLEVRWQSFRAVRGFTLLAAICDEVAYWWSEDSYANPDVETVAAIRPGLATTAACSCWRRRHTRARACCGIIATSTTARVARRPCLLFMAPRATLIPPFRRLGSTPNSRATRCVTVPSTSRSSGVTSRPSSTATSSRPAPATSSSCRRRAACVIAPSSTRLAAPGKTALP